MEEVQDLHLDISETQESATPNDATVTNKPALCRVEHYKWYLLVALYSLFVLSGQSTATLLGRAYFDNGGNSKWLATIVQCCGFPIILPLFLFLSLRAPSVSNTTDTATINARHSNIAIIALLYVSIGLLVAADDFLYSNGLLYLPVSTFSLICATQLAFTALFSYFLNSQKFTPSLLNSLVLLTISASLLAVDAESTGPTGLSNGKYAIGFLCTISASAMYAFVLSLSQLSFEKILRRHNFSVILEMQIYPSIISTCVCVVGLFASGEWRDLKREMKDFKGGKVSYMMNLVWTAVIWQVSSFGVVGLIFEVSSLFCNAISTVSLPVVPIFGVILFHDKMDGVKVMALLLGLCFLHLSALS